jgi:hypothetical protein
MGNVRFLRLVVLVSAGVLLACSCESTGHYTRPAIERDDPTAPDEPSTHEKEDESDCTDSDCEFVLPEKE